MKVKIIFITLTLLSSYVLGENIDPYDQDYQYSWAENAGWFNFEPATGDSVQISSEKLVGWIWAENIGWVSTSCQNTSSCETVNYGVVNDGYGNLSGYAWGENVGWINFAPAVSGDPTDYGVKIDHTGSFNGWAWGENIGWINFGINDHYVTACKVNCEDLANFANDWLLTGIVAGNLDGTGYVNLIDYSIFADLWGDFCPDQWNLK